MNFISFDQVKEILLKAKYIKVNNKSTIMNAELKQELLSPFNAISLYENLNDYLILRRVEKFFLYKNLIINSFHCSKKGDYIVWIIRYELY